MEELRNKQTDIFQLPGLKSEKCLKPEFVFIGI